MPKKKKMIFDEIMDEKRKKRKENEIKIDPYYLRRGDPNQIRKGSSIEGSFVA